MDAIQIHKDDNVAVALRDLEKNERIRLGDNTVQLCENVTRGHKFALRPLKKDENILKYGLPIGRCLSPIGIGEWVHTHNITTNLGKILTYQYEKTHCASATPIWDKTFFGYRRPSGKVGIRNEIWIIPTVSCVNRTAQILAQYGTDICRAYKNIDGCYALTHPYGCSQMGEDQKMTQRILAQLTDHPNAGSVLVLGLGCENNNIEAFKKMLPPYDAARIKFLAAQDVADEFAAGENLLQELAAHAALSKRTPCPVSDLTIGLKCGGSDGLSGITANPLLGAFSDLLTQNGGSIILTEVPEMFGAESLLMNRAADETVFNKTVDLINDFKKYFQRYNQTIYENPSPGNKSGGISTLEDKSLGCVQKGGCATVTDVLGYGDAVNKKGLHLLCGPGNDAVSTTVLAAAGCQIILFSTGRGTPWGTMAPTIKIATNNELSVHKANWIDFNAGTLADGAPMDDLRLALSELVLSVASGQKTKAELLGFREIAIWRDGVTL